MLSRGCKSRNNLDVAISTVLLALILAQPNFIFLSLFGFANSLPMVNSMIFLVLCGLTFFRFSEIRVPKVIFFIALIQIIYLLAHSLYFDEFFDNFAFISKIVIALGMVLALTVVRHETIASFYVHTILFLVVCGVLDFIITFVLGFNLLALNFTEYGGHEFVFTGLTAYHTSYFSVGSMMMPRYTFFLNEPGTFVFFAFWALILNRLISGSRKAENIILVGCVLTSSLYFFILAIAWVALFRLEVRWRNIMIAASFTILGAVLVSASQILMDVLDFFWDRNIYRLVNIGSGDNRGDTLRIIFEVLPDVFWFGAGREEAVPGSSGLTLMVYFGFIGFAVLCLHILMCLLCAYNSARINKSIFLFLTFFFAVTVAHREHIVEVPMIFFCFSVVFFSSRFYARRGSEIK